MIGLSVWVGSRRKHWIWEAMSNSLWGSGMEVSRAGLVLFGKGIGSCSGGETRIGSKLIKDEPVMAMLASVI